MVNMHPAFVGLLLAVNCTTIFRMGILPFLQKKGSGTGKRFPLWIKKKQKCVFFLVVSARTSILNTIININTVITLNTIINMKVPTCRRQLPTLNIESSTWNSRMG